MTTPILLPTDNPHELLDITCTTCKQRLIESREEAARQGWQFDPVYDLEEGIEIDEYFCPECFVEHMEDEWD